MVRTWTALASLGIAVSAACSVDSEGGYEVNDAAGSAGLAGSSGSVAAGGGGANPSSAGTAGAPRGGEAGRGGGSCLENQHACSGECVDDGSVEHCGTRCVPCPSPDRGTATCDGSRCGVDCGELRECEGACVDGCCTDDDCPPEADRAGLCDTSSNECRYDCEAGQKPCGAGNCISEDDCCSEEDCDGECSTCASDGTCQPVVDDDDPDSCEGTCDTEGTCASKQGQTCMTTPNGCVDGTVCAPDGYCCDTACNESCLACDLPGSEGTCTPVASGRPRGNRAGCGNDPVCGGSCAGRNDGECEYPTSDCGSGPSCSGDEAIGQASCSEGECVTPEPEPCEHGFACIQTACETSCSTDSDCQSDYFCEGGTCHLDAKQVSVGGTFSCALLVDGSVACWGSNQFGTLGLDGPSGGSSDVPILVRGIDDATAISAGASHACALLANGSVSCWGQAGSAQLGSIPSGASSSATPLGVEGLPSAVGSIACGRDTSCARIGSGGAVYCWGGNIFKQLGLDTSDTQSTTPVKVGSLNANAIATGTTTCAIASGGVQCWGSNIDGQAGQNPTGGTSATPSPVVGLGGVGAPQGISVGDSHACANVAGGSVYCWGWNMYEQLGDDATAEGARVTAVRVQGLSSGVTSVTAAYGHTCALLTNGRVVCWGLQRRGAIGDGQASEEGVAEDPVQVTDLANVTGLSTSSLHSCALLSNGAVKCWGAGSSGELGNGASIDSSVPVSVTGW